MHYTVNIHGEVAAYLYVFFTPTRDLSKIISSHADGFTPRKQVPVLQCREGKSCWVLVWFCGAAGIMSLLESNAGSPPEPFAKTSERFCLFAVQVKRARKLNL
jgi:hypothetical protein